MGVVPDWTISNYLEFVTTFLVSFGVVFELPVAIATLTFFGVTNSKWLASYRRHAIVVIFIVAAIFTPPDFISQITMAVPMVILYEVSILVSKMIEKKRKMAPVDKCGNAKAFFIMINYWRLYLTALSLLTHFHKYQIC